MKSILTLFLLVLSLLVFAADGDRDCAHDSPDSFAGVWESSYGHLFFTFRTSQAEIRSETDGRGIRAAFWSYADSHGMADNGRILGTVNGRVLDGFWVQDSGNSPCASDLDGSRYWGKVWFEANADFTEIEGVWSLCDQDPEGDDADWILWRDEIRDWNPAAVTVSGTE